MTDTKALEQKVLRIPEQARAIEVVDADSYEQAGVFLTTIKGLRKQIAETFQPIITKAHAAWKEALEQKKRHDEPLADGERVIKERMGAYIEQEERKRQEIEKKAREEAALAEAQEAESRGDKDAAERALDGRGSMSVSVPSSVPKVAGVSSRETWSAEVYDLKALIEAVAKGDAPLETVQANEVVLNGLARSLKSNLNYPGVRAVSSRSISGRG